MTKGIGCMTSPKSTRNKLDRLQKLVRSREPLPTTSTPRPKEENTDSKDPLSRLENELLGERSEGGAPLTVKERLERLVDAASRSRPKSLHALDEAERQIVSLDEVLNGQGMENDHGQFYTIDYEYSFDYCHGQTDLSRLKSVPSSSLSVLARGNDELDLDLTRTVFLDTETTGLAGGSGTCAFLVGIGFLEGELFRVRQFFMRDYSEEEAMLHELARALSDFESLVSFNGKSFDVPLLESRYILARQRFPLTEVPHFDLLHPARNLWKARLDSCRLTELEYALLGHEREDDVPGELIPGLYFDYIRSKDASRIHKVFSHNCHDILSLAALTIRASEMLDENLESENPLDDYSLGRIFERAELPERSIQHYKRVLDSGIGGTPRRRSLRQLAHQHKRRGEIEEALALWKDLIVEDGAEAIQACEELAMVHEHRDKDFRTALAVCDKALERIEEDYHLPFGFRERYRGAFQHRRRRLEQKLQKEIKPKRISSQ